jgi:hypothetical protein
VATEPSYTIRYRPDQKAEIARARHLRDAAANLRSRASNGSYGDEELADFWKLVGSAGIALAASNPELGIRAGLGDQFFSSVTRDRRRPKFANFLKALTAIIEVADERLMDIDKTHTLSAVGLPDRHTSNNSRLEHDHAELLLLATSLGRMARNEIQKLDSEPPNDPETIATNNRQRELFHIFADGFEQIASALTALSNKPTEPVLLSNASDIVNGVGKQINAWCRKNAADAVDWGIRVPVMAAGVAVLGWAGADMTIATSAVAALVGGPKVLSIIKNRKDPT